MGKHKGRIIVIVVVVIAALIGAGLILKNQNNRYELVAPKYGPVIEAVYGLGKVKTEQLYEVKLGITATVDRIYVKEGDRVQKADKLMEIVGTPAFRAPFAGTVTYVDAHENQSVFPQVPLLRLENLKATYIEVSLEQQAALRVRKDQKVRVTFENIRGETSAGVVSAIFPRSDEFLAHIKVAEFAEQILPGMTADLAIEVGRKEKALLVPLAAVNNGRLIVTRNGKRVPLRIKIGTTDGQWAEVLDGDLSDQDLVMVRRATSEEEP